MRIINYRMLGTLCVATLIVSIVAYAVHGYQVKRNASALLREAAAAKKGNDFNQAIDYLQRYVALAPGENVDSLADMGLMQADLRRISDAYRTLEAVLRQDRSRNDVRRRLVDVEMAMGRHSDASHHLTLLLKDSPDDSELILRLAECQAALKKPEEAAASYRLAIEKSPDRMEICGDLAELMHGPLENPLGALAVLKEMVERNPDTAMAYVVRGGHWMRHGDEIERAQNLTPAESQDDSAGDASVSQPGEFKLPAAVPSNSPLEHALRDARSAMKLEPDEESVITFAVRCFISNNLPDEARELAQRGVERFPKNPFLYGSLADLKRKEGDLPGAIEWFERGLKALPGQQDLLWNLADTLIDAGRPVEATRHLERLKELRYPRPPIAYLEAKALVLEQNWFEGSHQFEGVRPALLEWPDLAKQADFWLGQCYQQLGRNDLQLTAYRRAVEADSRWIPARMGIASGLLASGKLDEAFEEYRQIASIPSAPATVLAQLARVTVLINLSRNASLRDWRSPEMLVDRLEELDSESTAIPLLRAEILVAQGKPDEAEELLIAARDRSPDSLDLWSGLVSLAEHQGDEPKVKQLLDEMQHALGDSVPLRLARARHLVLHHPKDCEEELRRLATETDSFTADDQTALYAGLAGWTLAVGDFAETERLCAMVAERQPTNLRIRLLLFDLAFRAGNLAAMEQVLEQLHEIERSGPLWHYGAAIRLAVKARDEKRPDLYAEAKQHLFEARVSRPTWSRIPVLLGRINDAIGDETSAISNYLEAVQLGERSPEIVGRAVMLLYQRRRFVEADRLIRTLQEQRSPFSTQLAQLATQVSLRLNDRERTLSLVTQMAEKTADPVELIWAGRILSALGQVDEAEADFRKAIELNETSSDAWVALIQHLGRTVQLEKAETALKQAAEKIPPGEAPLAMAQSLESILRFEDAESQYQAALAAAPDEIPLMRRVADFWLRRNKPQDAKPLLEKLLKMESATEDDRSWGRRSLAVALMAQPTATHLSEALQLVNTNLKKDLESLPDRRAKALILANLPDPAATEEAAQILEDVLKQESSSFESQEQEARFVLAKLYVAMGDDGKALEHLGTLVAVHGDEPRFITYYIQYLISRKEVAEAELWLNRLVKVEGPSLQTLTLGSEISFYRERYEAILKAIVADVEKFQGTAAEQQEHRRQAAFLLENYGHRLRKKAESAQEDSQAKHDWAERFVAAADDFMRKYEELQPEGTLALSAFYARNGRIDESLDLLEKSLDNSPEVEIAAVSATVLTTGRATTAQMERLESLLDRSLKSRERSLVLVLALADHLNWSGKYSQAEQLYREALQKQSQNLAALNNLAVLLALQGKNGTEPLTLIQEAIAVAGTQPTLLDSRGTIRLAMGDPVHAAEDLRQAIALRPTSGSHFRLAIAELQQGRNEAARKAYQKASELGLSEDRMHPLERPLYRQLQISLR